MSSQPPELVDNKTRYGHDEALRWLGEHRSAAASVATGYVRLGGLVALAQLPGPADRPVRLLLGAVPDPGLGAFPVGTREPSLARGAFEETLRRLHEERDFDAFPESRRTASLDLVEGFTRSERVEVRRYTERFLHGKTYLFADLEDFFRRMEEGDASLLDEGQAPGSGSFAGEMYRLLLSRLLQEGTFQSLRRLPWGIGSAFVKPGLPSESAGAFFACRTSEGERQWRYVTFGGEIVREDLEMLRLIDPTDEPRADLPLGDALEGAWWAAAADICRVYNAKLDPKKRQAELPASQRWALEKVLRNPDLPDKPEYDLADEALGVGRNQLVRRRLSEIRRRLDAGELGFQEAADAVVEVVQEFGLRPEPTPTEQPAPISPEDLGVVCFQAVLPG